MVTQKFQTSKLQQVNLLTIQEVAEWAKISTKTVYRWMSDNKIMSGRGLGTGSLKLSITPKKVIQYRLAIQKMADLIWNWIFLHGPDY